MFLPRKPFPYASASDAPDSTSVRVCRMTAAKFLSSSWLPRMSRHCTSGRPASIITENCRVKTARFFAATFLPIVPVFFAASAFFSFAGVIRVTRICSRLSADMAASIVSAMRSPLTVCPARVRPEYAKVGMVTYLTRPAAPPRPRGVRVRRRRPRRPRG